MDCQTTSSLAVTHCDPTSAAGPIGWLVPVTGDASCPAQRLEPKQRRDLAIEVRAGTQTVSEWARQHEVSRKFLYHQAHTAEPARCRAFAPAHPPDDVLFDRPVTQAWLRQLILAVVWICPSLNFSPIISVGSLSRRIYIWGNTIRLPRTAPDNDRV